MKCCITNCNYSANGLYTFGKNKDEPLCKNCADELWEKCKGLVSLNLYHFEIKSLPKLEDLPSQV